MTVTGSDTPTDTQPDGPRDGTGVDARPRPADDRPDDRPPDAATDLDTEDGPTADADAADADADAADADADADADAADPAAPLRHTRSESIGAAVGSFLGGLEQAVFQRRPPAVELVRQATPVRGTTGAGLEVTIELPLPSDLDADHRR